MTLSKMLSLPPRRCEIDRLWGKKCLFSPETQRWNTKREDPLSVTQGTVTTSAPSCQEADKWVPTRKGSLLKTPLAITPLISLDKNGPCTLPWPPSRQIQRQWEEICPRPGSDILICSPSSHLQILEHQRAKSPYSLSPSLTTATQD